MNTQRPAKTFADYLVIAVSPALVMVMVHSVCFFLVEVFYRGAAIGSVRWVLFWFVLAVVLITRIGIHQGDAQAMGYGLVLAFVTWIYLSTVQPHILFSALLLASVWFTAHKLTSNCTLIDEDADASGQGLLQSIFRLRRTSKKAPEPANNMNTALKTSSVRVVVTTGSNKKPKSQTPGVWLIYFSLAALPMFGLGQMLLPAGDMAMRHQGFVYLFLYLAASLGLLVTTSFLGLRRYLRQRYLVMPGNIAYGWVQFGVMGAAIVLCLTLLFPRPGAGEAWGTLRQQVDYQLHRASEYAALFNPHGTDSGRSGYQSSPASQSPKPGQDSNQSHEQNPVANSQGDEKVSGSSKSGRPDGQESSGHSEQAAPSIPAVTNAVDPWVKTLFWLVAGFILVWLFFRYRTVIGMALRSMWLAIYKFIADLLGWFQPKSQALSQTSTHTTMLPFKTFKNPFLTGGDRLWSAEKLIIYTYDALQSWAMEQATSEASSQTPREFCRQLGEEMPEATEALQHLAYLYGNVVYGESLPAQYQPEQLRLIWDFMSHPRPVRASLEELTSVKNF